MSVEQIDRILKEIKVDYDNKKLEYPHYFKRFFEEPAQINIFVLSILFEELEKSELKGYSLPRRLYDYFVAEKQEYLKTSYADRLEIMLNEKK